jgi:hypothetical protein
MKRNNTYSVLLALCVGSAYAQANPALEGDTAAYKNIIVQMENQMEKNYDLDFRAPVQYSEYHYLDSSKELLQAVYIEGQQLSVRDVTQIPPKMVIPKYRLALGYKLEKGIHYHSFFGMSRGMNLLSWCFDDLNGRKEGKGDIGIDIGYLAFEGCPPYSSSSYAVQDTLYENAPCYKLTCKKKREEQPGSTHLDFDQFDKEIFAPGRFQSFGG